MIHFCENCKDLYKIKVAYSIEVQLLDYHKELDEWDNKLLFTEADANWHDKLYETMKVIVYE